MTAEQSEPDEIAHLRAELARSERMRRALADVIVTVGSNLGLQALLLQVASIVDVAYESYGAMVYLWDPEIERLVVRAATDPAHRVRADLSIVHNPALETLQLSLGEGITGWVAEHREPVLMARDPWKDARFSLIPGLQEELYRSAVLVPILRSDREMLGVLSIWSRTRDHFTPEHLRVLTEVTALLAGVIEKIRLDDELARRAKVLTFLGDLCGRLSSPRSLEELMDSVAELTAEVMASAACMIVTFDPSEGRFGLSGLAPTRAEVFADIDGRLGASFDRACFDGRADAASSEAMFRELAVALPGRFAEAASAPLLAGAEHLGFISCYRHRRYGAADRDLLSVIAGQVALGLRVLNLRDAPGDRDDAGELLGVLASGRQGRAASSIAASLGVDLTRPHVLLRARILPCADRDTPVADRFARALKLFVRTVEAEHPHSLLRESAGGVVGLVRLSRPSGTGPLQRRLQTVADDLARHSGIGVSAGMSSACLGPDDYADAYREAAEALEVGAKLRGEGRITRFEELGPDLYLYRMAADPRTRRDPWMRMLRPLLDHDRTKRADLLATLDAYLEARGNGTVTAENLGVHRNTLRQRLTRIEALTGLSLAETQDWMPLHFAVKLARMREGDPR